jgi:hypothetical protein
VFESPVLTEEPTLRPRQRRYESEEFARRGTEIYDRDIRPILKPEDDGKFVAIDIETGEYEMDEDERAALDRLWARFPDPQPWLVRVGYRAAHCIGCGSETARERKP